MKRASYRAGIFWLAHNDDVVWLYDLDTPESEREVRDPAPSVTACLLADLFGVTTERVTDDLRRELKKTGAYQQAMGTKK